MADEQLRDLERRFRSTGALDDERRWLAERLRAGRLSRERLEVAALVGHEAARAALGAHPSPGSPSPGSPEGFDAWLAALEARGLDVTAGSTLALARLLVEPAPREGAAAPFWAVVEAGEAWLAAPTPQAQKALSEACKAAAHISVPFRVASGGLSIRLALAFQGCVRDLPRAAARGRRGALALAPVVRQALTAGLTEAAIREALRAVLVRWALDEP